MEQTSYFLTNLDNPKYRTYSSEEEIEAFKKLENGNKNIKKEIIEHNLKLIFNISKKYASNQNLIDSIISFGIEGIYKAIKKYDYKKGVKFSTYATYWIENEIKIGLINEKNIIKIPIPTIKAANKYYNAYYQLLSNIGHIPSNEEIKQKANLTTQQINLIKNMPTEILSIDTKESNKNENINLIETISDNDFNNEFENIENIDEIIYIIKKYIKKSDTQKMILMKFGINQKKANKNEEIAKEFNISKQAVNKRIKVALSKLKEHYNYK